MSSRGGGGGGVTIVQHNFACILERHTLGMGRRRVTWWRQLTDGGGSGGCEGMSGALDGIGGDGKSERGGAEVGRGGWVGR